MIGRNNGKKLSKELIIFLSMWFENSQDIYTFNPNISLTICKHLLLRSKTVRKINKIGIFHYINFNLVV